MTDTAISVKTVNFELAPWRVEGERSERIWPVPGTWTLAPEPLLLQGIRGLISCPNCHKATLVPNGMGTERNGVLELRDLQCKQCGFFCHARLLSWDTRKLYCIAYEALDKITGLPVPNDKGELVRKEYTHAQDRSEAFTCFVEVRKHYGRFRVVDVGEVIGFWGKESDKDQTELSV
jgi:hypothetical protein